MSEPNLNSQLNVDQFTANSNNIRILLDFYITTHNQTIRRIDSLYDMLDEIRPAINILSGLNARINETNINYTNRNREYRNNHNHNFRYYGASANENINRNRDHYNGERANRGGRYGGRGTNSWNRNNLSGNERTRSWQNYNNTNTNANANANANVNANTNAIDYFDWLSDGVYIQRRPYRIEFERYNIPSNISRNVGVNNDMLNFMQNFYSTVPVIASSTQIQSATRSTRFSDIRNPMNSSCPITLEPFASDAEVTEILGCNHLFNTEALTSWLEHNVRCPVCRYDIRANRVVSRQQREEREEETKEETVLEETKEDYIPLPQNSEVPVERNSNSRRSTIQETDTSDNILETALTQITETLITQLFNGSSRSNSSNRLLFNNTFDASNNEIVFRGFRI
jgi:hypothetical protein